MHSVCYLNFNSILPMTLHINPKLSYTYFLFYSFFFGLSPDSTKLLNKNSLMKR